MDIVQWRRSIGLFSARRSIHQALNGQPNSIHGKSVPFIGLSVSCSRSLPVIVVSVIWMLLLRAGDIEINPGPTEKTKSSPAEQSQAPRSESQPGEPAVNVALRVFRKHLGVLLNGFESDPTHLAFQLCSKGLISAASRDHVLHTMGMAPVDKAGILLADVERVIGSDKNGKRPFKKFCSVIKEHHHMQRVATKLMKGFLRQCPPCEDDGSTDASSSSESSSDEQITGAPLSKNSQQTSSSHGEKITPTQSLAVVIGSPDQLPNVPVAKPMPPQFHPILCATPTSNLPPMETFLRFLKATYRRKLLPTYFKAPSLFLGAKCFINLVLVHRRREAMEKREEAIMLQFRGNIVLLESVKTSISMEEIGTITRGDKKMITRNILIEGAPGVGKTTLSWNLCRKWEEGELLQQWPVVVMLQLREKRIRSAKTLHDLFHHPKTCVRQDVVKCLEESEGNGLMLIFDGYDELSTSQLAADSIFVQILKAEILPLATVIVTSRPFATSRLPDCFKDNECLQHIEVVGFKKENIDDYISAACEDKPVLLRAFRSYLSFHPFVSSCMYNPLHCAMITELYVWHWNEGEKAFAPKTLTELYTYLVSSFLDRYLSDHPEENIQPLVTVHSFSNIPRHLFEKLIKLGNLAAKGVEQRQYIFDDVPCYSLGFLRKVENLYLQHECQVSHSFLHMTLQEFLAALYWSHNLSSKQVDELIKRHDLFPIQTFIKEKYFDQDQMHSSVTTHWPVLLFIAGLHKFKTLPLQEVGTRLGGSLQIVYPSLCHLLFECQCPRLIRNTFFGAKCAVSPKTMNSKLDWFVAGYSVAHSHPLCLWTVFVKSDQLEMLAMGLRYAPVAGGGKIDQLTVVYSSEAIFSLHPYTSQLTKLTLRGYPLNAHFFDCIPSYFPILSSIDIGDYDCTLSQYWPMVTILHKFKYLTELTVILEDTDIEKYPFADQVQNCQVLKKLAVHVISVSGVHSSVVATLSPVLMDKVEHIVLSHLFIRNEDAAALAGSLQSHRCSLRTLELRVCELDSTVVSRLATGIQNNFILRSIAFISSRCKSNSEIIALAQALRKNAGLEEVGLRYQPLLLDDGMRELVDSLNYNTRILLYLDQYYRVAVSECIFPRERVNFC